MKVTRDKCVYFTTKELVTTLTQAMFIEKGNRAADKLVKLGHHFEDPKIWRLQPSRHNSTDHA